MGWLEAIEMEGEDDSEEGKLRCFFPNREIFMRFFLARFIHLREPGAVPVPGQQVRLPAQGQVLQEGGAGRGTGHQVRISQVIVI